MHQWSCSLHLYPFTLISHVVTAGEFGHLMQLSRVGVSPKVHLVGQNLITARCSGLWQSATRWNVLQLIIKYLFYCIRFLFVFLWKLQQYVLHGLHGIALYRGGDECMSMSGNPLVPCHLSAGCRLHLLLSVSSEHIRSLSTVMTHYSYCILLIGISTK